jgi:predicted ATP-dependent endonuclease of OLD family
MVMLTSVEITNFLSVKSKQVLKFNKDITAIIGKNESGKSSILEAIVKLNGEEIYEDEKNVNCKSESAIITGIFKIDNSDVKKINSNYFENQNNKIGIYLLPEEYGDLYFSYSLIDGDYDEYYSIYYMKNGKLVEIDATIFFNKIIDYIRNIREKLIENMTENELRVFNLLLECEDETGVKTIYDQNIDYFRAEIKTSFNELINEIEEFKWVDLLPNYQFIKFSSFTDILKDEILISDIDKNIQAKNLLKIAKIDIEKLKKYASENKQAQIIETEKFCETRISGKFQEIYKQADSDLILKIIIDSKDNKLLFFTNDKTSKFTPIPLSKRSDGLRWYLSLYLTLYDYLEKNDNNTKYILLLDEPNMFLHAAAQKDLLERVFKKEFKDFQILYSTHSPYMIDTDNPYSIRIIEKKEETKIYTSSQDYVRESSGIEIDTITPLMVSLDLHLSNNLTFCITDKLLLVEGTQDLYILKAFIKRFDMEPQFSNIKIIACMGANTEIVYMFSYLFGMGYQTYLLVDDDKPGKTAIKELSEDLSDGVNRFLVYKKKKSNNSKLEDLFSNKDFQTYLDKKNTILYKRIYDNYNNIDLSRETENNFRFMLELILEMVNHSDKEGGFEGQTEFLSKEFAKKS